MTKLLILSLSLCVALIVGVGTGGQALCFDQEGIYELPSVDEVFDSSTATIRGQRGRWIDGIQLFLGADAWAARLDDDDWNNFGARLGINNSFALTQGGLNGQFGMSYGVYDWMGHEQGDSRQDEDQVFTTIGVYRRAAPSYGESLTYGVVWDYMNDDKVGEEHNQSIDLHQIRWRAGYATSEQNEFGLWGTFRLGQNESYLTTGLGLISVHAADQVSAYWEHYYDGGARMTAYLGWLSAPGELVVGLNGEVPITERMAMYGLFAFGKPSTGPGDVAPNGTNQSYSEAYWNIGAGIVVYLRGYAGGKDGLPLMPVADNSTFMVSAPTGAL